MTDATTLLALVERADDLVSSEVEVLRILSGEEVPGWTWGAAMAECLSSLKGRGYAAGLYHITPKGRQYLAALHAAALRAQAGEGE